MRPEKNQNKKNKKWARALSDLLRQHIVDLRVSSACICGCAANRKQFCSSGDRGTDQNKARKDTRDNRVERKVVMGLIDKRGRMSQMSRLHTQLAPNSGSVRRDPDCLRLGLIECVLLTCLGTRCRHIDEARSTWR